MSKKFTKDPQTSTNKLLTPEQLEQDIKGLLQEGTSQVDEGALMHVMQQLDKKMAEISEHSHLSANERAWLLQSCGKSKAALEILINRAAEHRDRKLAEKTKPRSTH